MTSGISIHGRLPGLNDIINAARTNRYGAARQKRETEAMIRAQLPRGLRIEGKQAWRFVWIEPNERRDPDNIAAGVKFIFDALQAHGVIERDGWKQVGSISHGYDKGEAGVVIAWEKFQETA